MFAAPLEKEDPQEIINTLKEVFEQNEAFLIINSDFDNMIIPKVLKKGYYREDIILRNRKLYPEVFKQIDKGKIESFVVHGLEVDEHLWNDILTFGNLTDIQIDWSDIASFVASLGLKASNTQLFEFEGLEKLTKLKWFYFNVEGSAAFPRQIIGLPDLTHFYFNARNSDYKHFFDFLLDNPGLKSNEEGLEKLRSTIGEILLSKKNHTAEEEDSESENHFDFKVYPWGLHIPNLDTFIVLDFFQWDKYIPIHVYVLSENRQDSFYIYNFYNELFSELSKKIFSGKADGQLQSKLPELEFWHPESVSFVSVEKLKQAYLAGNRQFKIHQSMYFVNKLIEDFGVKKLLDVWEQENKLRQRKIAEELNKQGSLREIEIKDFKVYENFKIEDLDQINLLVGKNSTGKTSLLQALALALLPSHSDQVARDEDYRDWGKFFGLINQKKLAKSRIVKQEFAEITLSWQGTFKRTQRIYPDELLHDQELPENYLVLGYGENIFSDSKYSVDGHLKALAEGTGASLSVASLFQNYYPWMPNPLEILSKLHPDNLSREHDETTQAELLAIGEQLLATLSHFLKNASGKQLDIHYIGRFHGYRFVDQRGNNLFLNQLSEGYRTKLVLLTDMLTRIFGARNRLLLEPVGAADFGQILERVQGTVLIDEFDKHLHPAWQRTFLGTLREVFPRLQFVLTTHNLVALQSAEGNAAFKLFFTEEGQIDCKRVAIKPGYSLETIYSIFFDGQNQIYADLTEKRLKRFDELFQQQVDSYKLALADGKLSTEKGDKFAGLANDLQQEFETLCEDLLASSERVVNAINRKLIFFEDHTQKRLL